MSDFGVTFDVVDGWILYELDPEQVDAMSAARVDIFLETAKKLRRSRGALIDLVVQSSIDAGLSGASSGAIRCDPTRAFGSTYASVQLNLIERDPERAVADDLDEIEAFVGAGTEVDQRSPEVERIELDGRAGLRVDAMRRAELDPLEAASSSAMLWRIVEYWVPLAGEIGIVKLTFSTPNLVEATELVGEFEHIAKTLRVTPS